MALVGAFRIVSILWSLLTNALAPRDNAVFTSSVADCPEASITRTVSPARWRCRSKRL